jgi:NAD(P)-dependent dehydrogenase (short-subunit alcohol dehydrogenase family)
MNIIISGASSGIGKSIVEQLNGGGHNVLAIARSKIEIDQSSNVILLSSDLSKEESIRIIQDSIKSWKHVDAIINNAGQLINKSFEETSTLDFLKQYEANFLTSVHLIRAALPKMIRASHIVNISSMGGFQGSAKYTGLSAYSSAKGAVAILTECLAEEFKEKGVHVNALALGAVQTEMLDKAFPGYNAPINSKEMAEYIIDFTLTKALFFNGKILPVALINP